MTEAFIQKAKGKHGDKYDYSKVEYINSSTKIIIIICKEHGEFSQNPFHHLNGQGCKKCGRIRTIKSHNLNTEEYIKKAIIQHKDKYDYSKVNYIKCSNKVIIICKEHGEFLQSPTGHLQGNGCRKCGIMLYIIKKQSNKYKFIEKARKVHGDDKYNYSKVEYINSYTKVIIICKEHGEFLQSPRGHLSGNNCYYCGGTYKSNTKEREKVIENLGYNLIVMWEYDWNKIIKSVKILQRKFCELTSCSKIK